jgi:hypothetical protein
MGEMHGCKRGTKSVAAAGGDVDPSTTGVNASAGTSKKTRAGWWKPKVKKCSAWVRAARDIISREA